MAYYKFQLELFECFAISPCFTANISYSEVCNYNILLIIVIVAASLSDSRYHIQSTRFPFATCKPMYGFMTRALYIFEWICAFQWDSMDWIPWVLWPKSIRVSNILQCTRVDITIACVRMNWEQCIFHLNIFCCCCLHVHAQWNWVHSVRPVHQNSPTSNECAQHCLPFDTFNGDSGRSSSCSSNSKCALEVLTTKQVVGILLNIQQLYRSLCVTYMNMHFTFDTSRCRLPGIYECNSFRVHLCVRVCLCVLFHLNDARPLSSCSRIDTGVCVTRTYAKF